MWQFYNANPINNRIGDCVIRAISTALNQPWEKTYADLCIKGLIKCELPNADSLWGEYLREKGFKRGILPCDEGLCVTVDEFCRQNPQGVFLLCPNNHIVAVIDGNYLDTWDCGQEVLNYFWRKEE